MNNAELIKALRLCGNYEDREGCAEECPYFYDRDCPKRIMIDAADALEAADKRIAELMPKEGEWIVEQIDDSGFKWCKWRCSACREIIKRGWQHTKDGEKPRWKYCPNCGAKMNGANDEQIH